MLFHEPIKKGSARSRRQRKLVRSPTKMETVTPKSSTVQNGVELGAPGDEYNKSPCREGSARLLIDKTHRPTTPSGILSRFHYSLRANHVPKWIKSLLKEEKRRREDEDGETRRQERELGRLEMEAEIMGP